MDITASVMPLDLFLTFGKEPLERIAGSRTGRLTPAEAF